MEDMKEVKIWRDYNKQVNIFFHLSNRKRGLRVVGSNIKKDND